MDLKHLLSLKIVFFLQAVLINTSAQICSAPPPVEFKENNTIGETVTTISIQEGVSLNITENPHNAFGINGNLLVAIIVLDFEIPSHRGLKIEITCMKNGTDSQTIEAIVFVVDVNDNPPVFAQNLYTLKVDELSKIGTPVGTIAATDLDDQTRLYYRLESPMGEFGLQTNSNPEILVKKVLDYDTVKEVTLNLIAQDTPLSSTETISHTAKTTVIVIIVDINNRSPWFQPCTEFYNGATRICLSSGYTGNVKLNEQTAGALTLKPGPVYAIDGDKEMNEPIGYTIIEGNINESFIINQQSGNITMQKPVSIAGNIKLTVMAYELENRDQFATTTVTLQVVTSSKHPPQFVKPKYEGFISEDVGVGSLVLESMSTNIPLQVQATDADFSNGVNPDIIFEVPADSDFLITPEGFIIMRRVASPGNVNLQISVVDVTNGESSTASLSVEVTTGVTTTDMPTTTNSPTSTAMNTTMATSTSKTTDMAIDITTDIVTQLTSSPYTEGVPLPSGDFRTEDMIALGVSLAVALLLCFVVIGFLAYTLRRFKSDWKKLSEASIFQSSLSRGPKDGVQYTNEDFQGDEDIDSVTSKEAAELPLPRGPELRRSIPEMQHSVPPLETQHSVPNKSSDDSSTLPTVSSSQNALDNTDDEKEVKPILTKERRMEEGYKAVWFKEDVNPNDKEEVVISERDQDFNHEEDDSDYDFDEENVDDDDDDDEYNA